METITNKIAKSGLITLDLERFSSSGIRKEIDIKDWLWKGIVVKEKLFKEFLINHDWEQYQEAFVNITCTTDAIIPNWAYMLIAKHLTGCCNYYILGSKEDMENALFAIAINNMDASEYKDKGVLVKGCSEKSVPPNAYVLLSQKLIPVVKSLMFGEACSNVPIYKQGNPKKKNTHSQ